MPCPYRACRACKNLEHPARDSFRAQQIVVGADRVTRLDRFEMIAVRASAAAADSQVTYARLRLKPDFLAHRRRSRRELSFEAICHMHKVFVESAQLQRESALDRKVSAHQLGDELAPIRTKRESPGALLFAHRLFARLQHLSGDDVATPSVSPNVSSD